VDDPITTEKLRIERKQFFLDLHENPRGQFLKVTEDVRGRRDTIIIPSTGLVDFRDAIERILEHVDLDEDEYEYVEVDEFGNDVDADEVKETDIEEGPLA